MKYQRSILALAAVLATAALATETGEPPAPHAEARQAVQTQIVARMPSSSMPPFSRVRPPQPRAHFHQLVVVDKEERLPFSVTEVGLRSSKTATLNGYIRLSDKVIFLFDPRTTRHVRADLDPRFAPAGKSPRPDIPG